jgi:hypothetical protein
MNKSPFFSFKMAPLGIIGYVYGYGGINVKEPDIKITK